MPIDQLNFGFEVLRVEDALQLAAPPEVGVCVSGLHLEGARYVAIHTTVCSDSALLVLLPHMLAVEQATLCIRKHRFDRQHDAWCCAVTAHTELPPVGCKVYCAATACMDAPDSHQPYYICMSTGGRQN